VRWADYRRRRTCLPALAERRLRAPNDDQRDRQENDASSQNTIPR
jgi:hypothetical protein